MKRVEVVLGSKFRGRCRDGEPSDAFPSESSPITVKAMETFLRFMNAKFIWDFPGVPQICD
jgi:hypothetical protein